MSISKFTLYIVNIIKDKKQITRHLTGRQSHVDYTFPGKNSVYDILKQLVLMDGSHLLNAVLMLFGTDPQRFCPSAVVKFSHYYGTEVTRPIPNHQVFGGTLFKQVDDAVDFVLSKLNRSVGGRQEGPVAEVCPLS